MSERVYGLPWDRRLEEPKQCVAVVWQPFVGGLQCSRPRGHGPGGLYCKQHAKMKEGEK